MVLVILLILGSLVQMGLGYHIDARMIWGSGIFGVINGVVLLYSVLLGNFHISGYENNLWPLWGIGADLKRIEMIAKFAEA